MLKFGCRFAKQGFACGEVQEKGDDSDKFTYVLVFIWY